MVRSNMFIIITGLLGIVTQTAAQAEGDVRLVEGNTVWDGRVEIFQSGQWGTVCDNSWDIQDADVVCQQLGREFALFAHLGGEYPAGTGPIFLISVDCVGDESSLISCPHSDNSNSNCSHSMDAGVTCSPRPLGMDNSDFTATTSSIIPTTTTIVTTPTATPTVTITPTSTFHMSSTLPPTVCTQACNMTNVADTSNPCNVVGECVCNQFWTGVTCNTDVDECVDIGVCSSFPNTVCENAQGSFDCVCAGGFETNSEGDCAASLLRNGADVGDTTLAARPGTSSLITISIPTRIPVGSNFMSFVVISKNGLISFGGAYETTTPFQAVSNAATFRQNMIAAPYFTSLCTSGDANSRVTYRFHADLSTTNFASKSDPAIQRSLEILLDEGYITSEFNIDVFLLVNWIDVTKESICSGETVTFQAALLSDGSSSYIIFIYGPDQMLFTTATANIQSFIDIFIGVSTGTSGMVQQHVASFRAPSLEMDKVSTARGYTQQAFALDLGDPREYKITVALSPDVTFPLYFTGPRMNAQCSKYDKCTKGIVVYSLTPTPMANNRVACKRLYYQYLPVFFTWSGNLPICPCFQSGIQFDRRFNSEFSITRPGSTCTTALESAGSGQFGKECCYRNPQQTYVAIRGQVAGGMYLYHENSGLPHQAADVTMRSVCCDPRDAIYCYLYFIIHPVQRCYISFPFNRRLLWGDPHFETLDRMMFTFNGHGEYTMLRTGDTVDWFVLQARTGRAEGDDGTSSDATIFTAFAAKDSNGASLHVELNVAKTGLIVYGNGYDLSEQFVTLSGTYRRTFRETNDSSSPVILTVWKETNAFFATFSSEISLKIGVNQKLLSLLTDVPVALKGQTEGLLGNFNDDASDDFAYPNGTRISNSSSERDIFSWGQSWMVAVSESVFRYPEGMNALDYRDEDFIPFFLDEATEAQIQEAAQHCSETSGALNEQCVFDFIVTQNEALAVHTLTEEEEVREETAITDNELPSLTGSAIFNVTVGDTINFPVFGQDDGTFEYIFTDNTGNATFSDVKPDGSVDVTATITDDTPINVVVSARDNNNAIGETLELQITVCSGCSGHGTCDFATIRTDSRETDSFKFATCDCDPYTTGADCGEDLDGCAVSPCSAGRSCTDRSISEHQLNDVGFTCGPCPLAGYSAVNNSCEDDNECDTNNGGCSDICINTEGSFFCDCPDGFQLASATQCRDINECVEARFPCSQKCENMDGGYNCSCYQGYDLDVDGVSCNIGVDPCSSASIDCSQAHGCTVLDGNATCFCTSGYELDGNNACNNINECDQNVCAQVCTDTEGSYTCSCAPGYRLTASMTTCDECPELTWGEDCMNTCAVNENILTCNAALGAICRTGWSGSDCTVDINECLEDVCQDVDKDCANSQGSFTCNCRTGLTLSSNGTCIDLNECDDMDLNVCEQTCVNSYSSFSCECETGFAVSPTDPTKCKDINECALTVSGCAHQCENTDGSYNCLCQFGYVLQDDRHTCLQATDPCAEIAQLNCTGVCVFNVSAQTAICGCETGYFLGTDQQTCIEQDECESDTLNECSQKTNCINTPGGYTCYCDTGFKLDNDGRTCIACDSNHYGENCVNECSCGAGALECNPVVGCLCADGWTGSQCRVPEDACSILEEPCVGSHEVCINTLGTLRCICAQGYERDVRSNCNDTDECSSGLNNCEQLCLNTDGSYTCECLDGFLMVDNSCTDIDECVGQHECDQSCFNLIGGYRCTCSSGFELDPTNLRDCVPTVECDAPTAAFCEDNNATCSENMCACKKGFEKLNVADDMCVDILECNRDPSPCSQSCTDTPGTFTCSCDSGYYLAVDNTTCLACPQDKYGPDCANDCTCVTANTESCDSVNGTCYCLPGWRQSDCSENIDECTETPTICDGIPRSSCVDMNGTYDCECEIGFSKATNGLCEECGNFLYGLNCDERCTCVPENTRSCDKITGTCTCISSGWVGDDCEVDYNECGLPVCSDNAICVNNNGSYACVCIPGYRKDAQQECTVDVNECLEDIGLCDFVCTNTPGSYTCSCPPSGYQGTGNDCTECTSNFWGPQCANTCDCGVATTIRCDNELGCVCQDGWQGSTCRDNVDECQNPVDPCSVHNTYCRDTLGSFVCQCIDGYVKNVTTGECEMCTNNRYGTDCSSMCTCNADHSMNPDQTCDHVNGTCICSEGWEGTNCNTDVNECNSTQVVCSENADCMNVPGGYECDCNVGFKQLQDKRTCIQCSGDTYGDNCSNSCNCTNANAFDVNQSCHHVTGQCICSALWEGDRCEFLVDPCGADPDACSHKENSRCEKIVGAGFHCPCIVGFSEDSQGVCFEICPPNKYGVNCDNDCDCITDNAMNPDHTCDPSNGTCICKTEWTGDRCQTDVNECNDPSLFSCQENAECTNFAGGYFCSCNDGYLESQSSCLACTNNTFGENCRNPCICEAQHTNNVNQTCDHVTGVCNCTEVWEGVTCNSDVNECVLPNDVCAAKANSGCHNTEGGFECGCLDGFMESQNGACITDTTPPEVLPPEEGEGLFQVSITFELELKAGEDLRVTLTKNLYKDLFKSLLLDLYRTGVGANRVTAILIVNVRSGSVIVDYNYTTADSSEATMAKLAQFHSSIVSLQLPVEVDGRSAVVQTMFYQQSQILVGSGVGRGKQACQLFETTNQCPTNFECEVDSEFLPFCQFFERDTDYSLEIGLGIGIPLFILLIILIITCIVLMRRRRRRHRRGSGSDSDISRSIERGFFPAIVPQRFRTSYLAGGFHRPKPSDDVRSSSSGSSDSSMQTGRGQSAFPYRRHYLDDVASVYSIKRPRIHREPHPLYRIND